MADEDTTVTVPDDGLTAGEREFFNSRGEKTEGLDAPATPETHAVEPAPVAATPAPAAAAPEPGTDDDDDEAPPKDRRVNWNKYRREQDARKKAESDLTTYREQTAATQARLQERLDLINQALTPAQQAQNEKEDPEPDPEQDIFGYVKWQARQIAKANDRLSGYDEREKARETETTIAHNYQRDAQRFAGENPDFAQAYVYLIRNRLTELEAYGVTDPAERDRLVLAEERDLVGRAVKDGKSPAERLYNLAKGRGYTKQATPVANGNGNGTAVPAAGATSQPAPAIPGSLAAAPLAAPAVPARPNVTEEIEGIKARQAAALSLSNVGGAPNDQLTPEALANMSQEEFSEVLGRMSKSRQRELLGH